MVKVVVRISPNHLLDVYTYLVCFSNQYLMIENRFRSMGYWHSDVLLVYISVLSYIQYNAIKF